MAYQEKVNELHSVLDNHDAKVKADRQAIEFIDEEILNLQEEYETLSKHYSRSVGEGKGREDLDGISDRIDETEKMLSRRKREKEAIEGKTKTTKLDKERVARLLAESSKAFDQEVAPVTAEKIQEAKEAYLQAIEDAEAEREKFMRDHHRRVEEYFMNERGVVEQYLAAPQKKGTLGEDAFINREHRNSHRS